MQFSAVLALSHFLFAFCFLLEFIRSTRDKVHDKSVTASPAQQLAALRSC